jgi:hypothetical protein
MPINLQQLAFKTFVTLAVALMGAYLAGLAYVLATNCLYYLAALTLIVFHIFGLDLSALAYLSYGFDIARSNETAMYVAGVIGFCGVAALIPRQLDFARKKYPGIVLLAIFTLAFTAGVAADVRYGITPLSDIAFGETAYNAHGAPVAYHLSVNDVAVGQPSNVQAEVEGVLEYVSSMRRFRLRSTASNGPSVNLYFFRHQRTLFSGMLKNDRPRYYDNVAPLIGKRVKVLGHCLSGQIDVEVANIQQITEVRNNDDEPAPLAPL